MPGGRNRHKNGTAGFRLAPWTCPVVSRQAATCHSPRRGHRQGAGATWASRQIWRLGPNRLRRLPLVRGFYTPPRRYGSVDSAVKQGTAGASRYTCPHAPSYPPPRTQAASRRLRRAWQQRNTLLVACAPPATLPAMEGASQLLVRHCCFRVRRLFQARLRVPNLLFGLSCLPHCRSERPFQGSDTVVAGFRVEPASPGGAASRPKPLRNRPKRHLSGPPPISHSGRSGWRLASDFPFRRPGPLLPCRATAHSAESQEQRGFRDRSRVIPHDPGKPDDISQSYRSLTPGSPPA